MTRQAEIYDTTLRDGTQGMGVSPTPGEKLRVARLLDELGVHFIEGGWPGANPKDDEFFERAKTELRLERATLVAFGSTRRPRGRVSDDAQLQALLRADTDFVCIVGKSWDRHVLKALDTSLEDGLAMVGESIEFLRERGKRVFFDAEHFFDGYRGNREYALAVVETAARAGAERIVLCDTNGGTLPHQVADTVRTVAERVDTALGVHFHNDSGCAVANTVLAFQAGATQLQVCVNGYGERTGNADLCSVVPNLTLKLGVDTIPAEGVGMLHSTAHRVAEIMGKPVEPNRPYVGSAAFAHKAGLHTSGLARLEGAYEHIDPKLVGNSATMLVSELMGRSTVLSMASRNGWELDPATAQALVERVKTLEAEGYQFEAAEGSLELLVRGETGGYEDPFETLGVEVRSGTGPDGEVVAVAELRLRIGGGEVTVTAKAPNGPVDALDRALREALRPTHPEVDGLRLVDFKVRDLDSSDGTAARVRVLVETSDGYTSWGTVGVHRNIIQASWLALSDGIKVGLVRARERSAV
ncbi:MAG: citramalate synthase [Actinomycetes bacterium]|jgi:2-isopropylmalate synthase|nr:MAG: citramalate synthase [Actinomycetota bacterium]